MEHSQSFKDVVSNLPDKVFTNLLMLFNFFLNETLNDKINTAISPPSANSIRMQRVLPSYSKNALLYEIILGESIDASNLTSFRALSFSLALS